MAPLLIEWSKKPKITGRRLEGSIKVSNQTGQDFDLTFVALAVDPTGRATAVGYQHFTLKNNTDDFEIPFGENLPFGAYELHADAIAEVAETNTIYRARLTTEKSCKSCWDREKDFDGGATGVPRPSRAKLGSLERNPAREKSPKNKNPEVMSSPFISASSSL